MSKEILDDEVLFAECKCGCRFLYEREDMKIHEGDLYVSCPACGESISVSLDNTPKSIKLLPYAFARTIAKAERENGAVEFSCEKIDCGACPFYYFSCGTKRSAKEWEEMFEEWREAQERGERHEQR